MSEIEGVITRQLRFEFNGGEQVVLAMVTVMDQSLHLHLSAPGNGGRLDNLSASMKTRFEHLPVVSQLMSSHNIVTDNWGSSIGQKLALRLKAQVFVSCSLPEQFEAIMLPLELELAKALATTTAGRD